jgi:hypothetical protein
VANLDATSIPSIQSQPGPAQPLNGGQASRPSVNAASQGVYYCGALTRKGTPCSRRVRKGERCWQHAGLPPMDSEATQRGSK